jgi:hypothetical protein
MRRMHPVLLVTLALGGSILLGSGAFVAAQDADPSDHALVGTWLVTYPEQSADEPPYRELVTFFAEGTALVSSPDGSNAQGVWEPTGETTATATMSVVFEDGTRLLARIQIELAANGESYTSVITNEFFDPSGEGSGEIGPGHAEGTRLQVEAPGTPIASFEEYFGAPAASPEATPAG